MLNVSDTLSLRFLPKNVFQVVWRGVQRSMARASSRAWERARILKRPLLFLQILTRIAQLEFSAAAAEVINCVLISLGPSTTPDSSALLTQLYLISNSLHRPFRRGLRPTTASLLSHLADEKWRQCVGN